MRYLIIFLFNILFAIDVYIPENAKYYKKFFNNKEFNVKFYKDVNKLDLNNSLAIVPYYFIKEILEKNYKILASLEEENEYLITHAKLNEIHSIAKSTFESKILFSILENNVTEDKNANMADFLEKKVDAIILNAKLPGYYSYNLKNFGIEFNKFYLISSNYFINNNIDKIEDLVDRFEESPYINKKLVYKSFMILSFYLNKKINFNKLLYENYLDDQFLGNTLKVILTSNWPPFNFIEDKELKGIGVDFWKLLAKKANLKYKFIIEPDWSDVLKNIKNEKADLTIATSETKERLRYAVFTKPYMKFPLALVCRKDLMNDKNLDELIIGVGKNYTAEKLMKKNYPNISLVEEINTIKGLKDIENGKLDCVVDILPVLAYLVNKENFFNVKLYKKLPIEFKLQIMIRKDLVSVRNRLNEIIDNITSEEKNEIINKYIGLIISEKIENKKVKFMHILIISILILIILFLIIKYLKIRKIANYDKLTQIYNRAFLSKELKKLLKHRGSIIYFDIDHFKKINDTYGHEKGDFVLKELSKVVKYNLRKDDIFGRWGGEEFLILLPNTNYEAALKVAEKLRKAIENYDFDGIKVTISFGVTSVKKDDNEETLLERADEALYEAKNGGRNQVKGKI